VFFGTLREVASSTNKIITQLGRGSQLRDLIPNVDLVNSDAHPESLVWIDKVHSVLGATPHFILMQLGHLLLSYRQRLDMEKVRQIVTQNQQYLSSTVWGTLIMNYSQGYLWLFLGPVRRTLSKSGCLALLRGTVSFWDEIMALGQRYFVGGTDKCYFNEARPLCSYVLRWAGIDPSLGAKRLPGPMAKYWGVGNIKELCLDSGLIEKIESDEHFWREMAAGKLLTREDKSIQ
jgi:hypothetical protein